MGKVPSDQSAVISGRGKKKSSLITAHSALLTSPTYRALTAVMNHPIRGSRRPVGKDHSFLTLADCRANNLKNVDAAIPFGRLTVLTGISGSGKSSLMHSRPFQKRGQDHTRQEIQSPVWQNQRREIDQSLL